jgi:hypothetical protein
VIVTHVDCEPSNLAFFGVFRELLGGSDTAYVLAASHLQYFAFVQ